MARARILPEDQKTLDDMLVDFGPRIERAPFAALRAGIEEILDFAVTAHLVRPKWREQRPGLDWAWFGTNRENPLYDVLNSMAIYRREATTRALQESQSRRQEIAEVVAHYLEIRGWPLQQSPQPLSDHGPAISSLLQENVSKARKLLTGWHEITDALDMNYSDRKKIISLNARRDGPIKNRGVGKSPMVYRDELIEWWNKMEIQGQESWNRSEGAKLSGEAQYNFGREGTVAPEIGGTVKRRRKRT